jgi:hypothetical protein
MKPFWLGFSFFLFIILTLSGFVLHSQSMNGFAVGDNINVGAHLSVGENYPSILYMDFSDNNVILVPNSTKTVTCTSVVQDYNGEDTIASLKGVLYSSGSSLNSVDDKNDHYTNSSCSVINTFGSYAGIADDQWTALGVCTFNLEFFSDPGNWTCNLNLTDNTNLSDSSSSNFSVSELLSMGLPDYVNYGVVNSTYVSSEVPVQIINYGNVKLDLSLSGYGSSVNDGYAMSCTHGAKEIPIGYQKYTLGNSITGAISLTEFNQFYTNLTTFSNTANYNLNYRHNDITNDAMNYTYWRIYVPRNVAGSCSGNIVFGAVKSIY